MSENPADKKVLLWTIPISQPSRSVEWFLRLTNIPYDAKPVRFLWNEVRNPEFRGKFVQHTVPALEHGDVCVGESGAILQYLASVFGKTEWYPTEPAARACVDEYVFFHSGLGARNITRHVFAPWWLNMFGAVNDYDKGLWMPGPRLTQGEARAKANMRVAELAFRRLEDRISRYGYVAGDHPTIADLLVVPEVDQLIWAKFITEEELNKDHAALAGWLKKMQALPHYDDIAEAAKTEFVTLAAVPADELYPYPWPESYYDDEHPIPAPKRRRVAGDE